MTRTQGVGARAVQAVLLCVAAGVALPAFAQTETEPRVWTALSLQGRVGQDSGWRWAADSLVRTRNGARTMDFAAEWLSVSRDLTPRSTLGLGYAYGAAFPDAGSLREHRFIQQYTWTTLAAWKVSFRTRLEERFISGHDAVLVRVRQQVRTTWPLAANGAVRGVASAEVLFKANSTARTARGLDSERVFVGVGQRVTERSYVEIGYVNVYAPNAPGRRHSHAMSATLAVSTGPAR